MLAGALVLGACSGDDGDSSEASTATSSLDPGVSFDNDVTVPTDGTGRPTATTVAVDPTEVETLPREVPEEFPGGFPVPEGATVDVGSIGRAEGELRVAVDYSIAQGPPADVFAFYTEAVADEGWSVLLNDTDGEGQEFIGQLVFETDRFVGNVLVTGDGRRGVLLTLTATLPD